MSEANIELDVTCNLLPLSQASEENATKSVSDDMSSGDSCLHSQAEVCLLETKGEINTSLDEKNKDPEYIFIYDPELSGNYFHHIISSAIDDTDEDKNKTYRQPSVQANRPLESVCKTGPCRPANVVKRKKPINENLYKRLMTSRLLGPANQSRDSCCSQYCFLTWQRQFRQRRRLIC